MYFKYTQICTVRFLFNLGKYLFWGLLVLKEKESMLRMFSVSDHVWTGKYRESDAKGTSWLQVEFGYIIEIELERLARQIHRRRFFFTYFPSTQSQRNLFAYFLPLSRNRAHPYLYLVKDPGRQKVYEGDKFHFLLNINGKSHKTIHIERRMKILNIHLEI